MRKIEAGELVGNGMISAALVILLGIFISWEVDPGKWDIALRGIMMVVWIGGNMIYYAERK